MFKLKLSLYGKLLLLAGALELILVFILVFGAFGFNVLNDRDKVRYAETIMLESYHLRSEFSKKKELKITDKFHSNMIKFQDIFTQFEEDPKTKKLMLNVNEYHSNFEDYILLLKKRGLNENKGVEGRFRNAVHNIEDIIKKTDHYMIYVDMLQARRREKDYIMRRKPEYIGKVENEVNKIINHTKNLNIDENTKKRISDLSYHYLSTFYELVNVFKEIEELEKKLEQNENIIRRNLESIVSEKAAIAEMNQDIQIYVAAFTLIFGILLSVFIARNITKPVVQLEEATSKIAKGDLSTKVSIKTGDEIEQLAERFNEMVTNLKRSKDTVQNQKEELKKKNEKLESLAVELQNSFENLSLLNQIGKSITSALSFDEVFNELYHHISTMIDSPIFAIGLFDDKKKEIDYKLVIKNSQRNENFKISMNQDNRLDVLCIKTGQNILINDYKNEKDSLMAEYGKYINNGNAITSHTLNINSAYYMPVKVENKIIGVLIIESKNYNAYRNHHIDILNNLGSYVAVAMINARSYENLKNALDELKKTQSQLIQAEKMASLGQLTTGIAHEIKNPLNFINNYSEGTLEFCNELRDDLVEYTKNKIDEEQYNTLNETIDELGTYLTTINNNGKRIDRIVKSMMEHAGGTSAVKTETDLNSFLKEYVKLAYNGFRGQYKTFQANINYDLNGDIPPVPVMQQELSRVITNIIDNACYSAFKKAQMNKNGFIPEIEIKTDSIGDNVQITLKDNGLGIKKIILDKIFNPFFTTKPTGEGTGLGLSLSYDIIKNGHNGEMSVISEEGEYAEFVITIPVKK